LEKKQNHRAQLQGWIAVGCVLALVLACILPGRVFAQASAAFNATASSNSKSKTSAKAKIKTKTTSSKQPAKAVSHSSSTASDGRRSKSRQVSSRRKKTARGQQKIDSVRAQAIQEALIREHYLSGTASGTWNQASEDAMRRYQAEHGWQSKTVPDSRALISLGLGPSNDHLLNPDSAMTTGPSEPRAASLTPASHSAEPGARMSVPPSTTSGQDGSGPQ
jgi:hypothetical protein